MPNVAIPPTIFDLRYGAGLGRIMGTFIDWVKPEEPDNLSFMESFDFPDLEELRTSLTESHQYTTEQVQEIVSGLATLAEYRD